MILEEERMTPKSTLLFPMKRWLSLLGGVAILMGLYLSSLYNYLLFHSLAEIFSIVIACGVFMTAWNSRELINNGYLMLIGVAYLFIGCLDLIHTFAYAGMPIFPGHGSNLATQFWIAARYVESLSLLIAPFFLGRKLKAEFVFLSYAFVTLFVILSIFWWNIFPTCYIEGTGLTSFKKVSEYVISLILSASAVLLLRRRKEFDRNILLWLFWSIVFTIASEMAFTFYVSVYGLSNLIGHYFKIISFFLIYKAIIATGLSKPFDLLFRELKRSEGRYRSLFDHMFNGFADHRALFDKGGKPEDYVFLEVNEAFERLTGLNKEALIGKKATEVIPGIERDPADWIGIYGKVATTGEPVRFENFSEQLGRWYSVSAYSPGRGYFATVFEDITERKQAEATLRQSESRFRLLSGTADRLLKSPDPQGVVNELCRQVMEYLECHAFFNFLVDERAGRLHLNAYAGIPEEEARKIEWLDYGVAVCGCVARDCRRIVAEDIFNTPDIRTELVKSYGMKSYACHPLMAQGRLIGTLSFGSKRRSRFSPRDLDLMKTVTDQVAVAMERIRLIGQLQKSRDTLEARVQERTAELERKNRDLQEFTFIASHDLQEPLRKICTFGDMLLKSVSASLDPRSLDFLNRMQKATMRMRNLLGSLLSYSRVTSKGGALSKTLLSEAVEEALSNLEIMIKERGALVEVGDLPVLEADGVQMIQVFQNLISNALKYQSNGNRPRVKIYASMIKKDRLGKIFRIFVEDNGIGFAEKHRDRIFAPFQRLHGKDGYEGVGMGLAICKKIVERHGGKITAKSTPGKGSVFIIELPSKPGGRDGFTE
jgi:PAS domain S-box-containing protein